MRVCCLHWRTRTCFTVSCQQNAAWAASCPHLLLPQLKGNVDGKPNLAEKVLGLDNALVVHERKVEMQAAMRELQVTGTLLLIPALL